MNIIKRVLFLLIFVVSLQMLFSQTKHEVDYIKKLPPFTIYGDNYFITGTSLNNGLTPTTSDVKFELGFKQRLKNIGFFGIYPFLSYHQKAFWNIYEESSPFREINYNPAVGLVKLFVDKDGITDAFWLTFEHESNGRDKENSRTWNFLALSYLKPLGKKWQLRSKVWYPIGSMLGNEDLISYRGYFSLGATYRPVKKMFVDVDLHPAYRDKLTGFIKVGLSFKIFEDRNQYLYIQYFGGYSEDLINYNQSCNKIRVGIIVKDLLANFH